MARASQLERIIAKGQLVPLMFTRNDVAASLSASALNLIETGATSGTLSVAEYVMPFDFEVVAVAASVGSARTAGTLTVRAQKNGTAIGPSVVIDGTNTTRNRATQRRGTDVGVAGDRIGAQVTTDSAWAPTTADLVVVVYVLAHLENV